MKDVTEAALDQIEADYRSYERAYAGDGYYHPEIGAARACANQIPLLVQVLRHMRGELQRFRSALGEIAEIQCRGGECKTVLMETQMCEVARDALGLLPLSEYNVVTWVEDPGLTARFEALEHVVEVAQNAVKQWQNDRNNLWAAMYALEQTLTALDVRGAQKDEGELEFGDGWVRCKKHSRLGEWFGVLNVTPEDRACLCIKRWRNSGMNAGDYLAARKSEKPR